LLAVVVEDKVFLAVTHLPALAVLLLLVGLFQFQVVGVVEMLQPLLVILMVAMAVVVVELVLLAPLVEDMAAAAVV
jgi:hypothetical protein